MNLTNVVCAHCGKSYGIDWTETASPAIIKCATCKREFTVRR